MSLPKRSAPYSKLYKILLNSNLTPALHQSLLFLATAVRHYIYINVSHSVIIYSIVVLYAVYWSERHNSTSRNIWHTQN